MRLSKPRELELESAAGTGDVFAMRKDAFGIKGN
jgi:hypothetical protein